MKRSKFLWVCAVALGFAACTTDEVPGDVNQHETDTYASVTIKFPGKVTRGLPGDYNEKNTWVGRDKLETVTVFLVNTGRGVVDFESFAQDYFDEIDATGVLKPNLVLKANAGDNVRVYVVVNGETDILNTLETTRADLFAAAFAGEAEKNASDVARYESDKTEVIMMTNDEDKYPINLEGGVTEEEAKAETGRNHIQVNVERVVARAMLTVVKSTDVDKWTVKAIQADDETAIATVTEVTYAVGQSNTKFYIMKKADYSTPDPVYSYVPASDDWATKNAYFDYSGLEDFTPVQQWAYSATDVATQLAADTTSKFVLPVTHAVDKALNDQRAFYKKGNTTYFEIRAKFMPLLVDGEAPTFTKPQTVYLGANDNKFYSTRALAEAKGQKATKFTDGVMKYILWLNPNSLASTPDDPNPKVSPTVRNQVYHAHIDAFLRMGLPYNPLNPDDPNDDPDNPVNPISPYDPLKSDYTYLSVSVQVVPWTIHSYKISLSDPSTMY